MKTSSAHFSISLLFLLLSACVDSDSANTDSSQLSAEETGTSSQANGGQGNTETVSDKKAAPDRVHIFADFDSEKDSRRGFVNNLFAPSDEHLYFQVRNNEEDIWELWNTDGTEKGTKKIGAFSEFISAPKPGNGHDYSYLHHGTAVGAGDNFYFIAGKESRQYNLYLTQGTAESTRIILKDISRSPNSGMYSYNGKVYFTSRSGDDPKVYLFELNGDQARQLGKKPVGTMVQKILDDSGDIYFVNEWDHKIYQWDGSNLRDVVPALGKELKAIPNGFEIFGSHVFFYALNTSRSDYGPGVYAADFESGKITTLLKHPDGVLYDDYMPHMISHQGKVYFFAPEPSATKENFTGQNIKQIQLWQVGSNLKATPVNGFTDFTDTNPYVPVEFNGSYCNKLFFDQAYKYPDGAGYGKLLYAYDTGNGKVELVDTFKVTEIDHFTATNDASGWYFGAREYHEDPRLWRVNTSSDTPLMIANEDGIPDYKIRLQRGISRFGEKIYFVGSGESGSDLWVFEE